MRSSNPWNRLILLAVLAAAGLGLMLSLPFLDRYQKKPVAKERDLYLPEADYLKFISLGHDGLVSDLVLAKAMTYYGSHYKERRTFGFRHLKKLLATAIEMDPMNKDAILLSGNILSGVDVLSAVEVLNLGMRYHPTSWKFPEMIGYLYFFRLNDSYRAARYYEKAASLPGHPPYVPSLSGKFYRESGRYREAIRVLHNFYASSEDPRLKKSFKDSIDRIMEKLKNKDFYLKASITEVRDAATVRFRPDRGNPQFTFLGPEETLRLKNLSPFPIDSADPGERLFALFQRDFARFVLSGANVKIRFEREANGQLACDETGAYCGSVFLKNEKEYGVVAEAGGIYGDPRRFPPPEQALDPGNPFRQTGRLVSLRFRVYRVSSRNGDITLDAGEVYRNPFTAVVPKEFLDGFTAAAGTNETPGRYFKGFEGRWVTVSGLAVVQGKRVRMNLYFPMQLKES